MHACYFSAARRPYGRRPRSPMSSALATGIGTPLSRNTHLLSWIEECVQLTKPDRVVWCDGSAAEKDALTREAVRLGILIPLNQKKLPGCYLHRSNPNDVGTHRAAHLHLHENGE